MVTSEGRPRRRGRVYIRALAMLTALLIFMPSAAAHVYNWDDIAITEVDSWDDPLREGEELLLDVSPDGSKLALAGTGGRVGYKTDSIRYVTLVLHSDPQMRRGKKHFRLV